MEDDKDFIDKLLNENNNNDSNKDEKVIPKGMTRLPNGKLTFEKGNTLGGRPKGVLNSNTIRTISEISERVDYKKFAKWLDRSGFEKYKKELEGLEGRDYINAFIAILPYFKGKVANVTITDDDSKIIPLDTHHTITIRDMRDGSVTSIDTE